MKITYAMYEPYTMKEYTVNNSDELAQHILTAWNYEECVFLIKEKLSKDMFLIFDPFEDIDNNNDWLEEYDLGIREGKIYFELYNLKTNKTYKTLD